MRYPILLSMLSALLCFTACKRTARTEVGGLPPKLAAPAVLEGIERALYVPPSAELKGDAQLSGGDFGNVKLAVVVRLRQDSAFWFTLRKFGFEGARGLVTADSVIVVNRLQREALVKSAADLPEAARVLPIEPTVGNLTAAFGGAPIGDWRGADVQREVGRYVLTSARFANAEMIVDGRRMVPTEWRYRDGEKYGRVEFTDFRDAGRGQIFPYGRSLSFSDSPGDTTRVKIQFNSLDADDALRFPISVPADYDEMSF